MKTIESKVNVDRNDGDYTEFVGLVESAENSSKIVAQWLLKPNRSLVVTSGFDDDDHHESVCFIPVVDDKEIAEIYVPLEQFREERCGVVPVHEFVRGVEDFYHLKLDDEFDGVAEKAGLIYHEDLAHSIGSFEAVHRYALGYMLSDGGTVEIYRTDISMLLDGGEIEDQNLLKFPLYTCTLSYQQNLPNGGPRTGFTEHVSFQLRSAQLDAGAFSEKAGVREGRLSEGEKKEADCF